jgi:hypothetical protein
MRWYRNGIAVMAAMMVVIGFALIFKGAFDGKAVGLVLGALFVAVGAGRLYLLRRR